MGQSVPSIPITPLTQHLMALVMVGHFVIKGPVGVGTFVIVEFYSFKQ